MKYRNSIKPSIFAVAVTFVFFAVVPGKAKASICDNLSDLRNYQRTIKKKSLKNKRVFDMCSSIGGKMIKNFASSACGSQGKEKKLSLEFLNWSSDDVRKYCSSKKKFKYSEWKKDVCILKKENRQKGEELDEIKKWLNPKVLEKLGPFCSFAGVLRCSYSTTENGYTITANYNNPYDQSNLHYCFKSTNSKNVKGQEFCGQLSPGSNIFTFKFKDLSKETLVALQVKGIRGFSCRRKLSPSLKRYDYNALNNNFFHYPPVSKSPRFCAGNCGRKALELCKKLGHSSVYSFKTRDETRAVHSIICSR